MTSAETCTPDLLRDAVPVRVADRRPARVALPSTARSVHVEPGWLYRRGRRRRPASTCCSTAPSCCRGGSATTTSRSTGRRTAASYAGAWNAYLGDRVPQVYDQSMRRHGAGALLRARRDRASRRHAASGSRWRMHLLEGLFYGLQQQPADRRQRERLLALGSLSAGLTHELNNPAAAAVRATATLRERVAGMRHKLARSPPATSTRRPSDR